MKIIVRTCGGWNEDTYTTTESAVDGIAEMLDTEQLFRDYLNETTPALDFGAYGRIDPADALEACDRCAYYTMLSDYKDELRDEILNGIMDRADVVAGYSVEYEEDDETISA